MQWMARFNSQPVSTQSRTHAGPWVGNELSTLVTIQMTNGKLQQTHFYNNTEELHTPPEIRQDCPPGRLPGNQPRASTSQPWGQLPSRCRLLLSRCLDSSSSRGPGAGCSSSRLERAL